MAKRWPGAQNVAGSAIAAHRHLRERRRRHARDRAFLAVNGEDLGRRTTTERRQLRPYLHPCASNERRRARTGRWRPRDHAEWRHLLGHCPEGATSIPYRGLGHASDVPSKLKLTSRDLKRPGLVDAIVPELRDGGDSEPDAAALFSGSIINALGQLQRQSTGRVVQERYER